MKNNSRGEKSKTQQEKKEAKLFNSGFIERSRKHYQKKKYCLSTKRVEDIEVNTKKQYCQKIKVYKEGINGSTN